MAGGKLFTKALSLLLPRSSPIPLLRRLSAAAISAAGDVKPSPGTSVPVLHFLRGRGLGDEVLAGLDPRLLGSKVGEDLLAKFDLLLARGFSVPEVARVLRFNHHVSLLSLRERLDAVRAIVSDDADLPRIINRAMRTLSSSKSIQRMVDNASKLRGWGVPDAKIKSLLARQPRFFQLKPQRVDGAVDRAIAYGILRDSKSFADAVLLLYGLSESTMQSKFRVLESFGWERSAVIALLNAFLNCFNQAEATLLKKLRFLVNEVGCDQSYVTRHPKMLGYSLEKRLRPRFDLVNGLKSKNLLPKGLSVYSTVSTSQRDFMANYVVKFMKEEPGICNAYITTTESPKQLASG